MISTSIDGSSENGAEQLFNLLSVVSNPAEVKKRIDALNKAQADAQAVIDLVGPAQQVLSLREKAAKDADDAKKALSAANEKAEALIADANTQAAITIEGANASAQAVLADAKAKGDAAAGVIDAANEQLKAAQKVQDAADKAMAKVAAAKSEAAAAQAAADKAQADAEALKAAIIEKHKAFIESL